VICEHCKQRHATVNVTQVQNGQKFERHYCEVCAAQFHPFQFDKQDDSVSLSQLLSNLFNLSATPISTNHSIYNEQLNTVEDCVNCGCSYHQFLKQGKFGCAQCYDAFSTQLPKILQRLQAGVEHVGSKEVELNVNHYIQQIKSLKEKQKEAIEQELFEDAAKLRDEIRKLAAMVEKGGGDAE
jgi:protein arginine kinase activator